MNLRLLNEIKRRYYDYEANGESYSVSVWYTTPFSKEPVQFYTRQKGAERFEDAVEKLTTDYHADTIIVEDYNGTNNRAAIKNAKTVISVGADFDKTQSILMPEIRKPEPTDYPKDRESFNFLLEQFNGFGGVQGALQRERDISQRDVSITLLQATNKNLEREKDKLEREVQHLENELDKLDQENDQLRDAVQKLDRYYPGKFKIAGFDGMQVLGMVASAAVENLIKKNASGISKTFGLPRESLLGIFDNSQEQESISQPAPTEPATNNARLDAINNLMVWLSNLNDEKYTKVAHVIDYVYNSDEQLEQMLAVAMRGRISNPDNEDDDN